MLKDLRVGVFTIALFVCRQVEKHFWHQARQKRRGISCSSLQTFQPKPQCKSKVLADMSQGVEARFRGCDGSADCREVEQPVLMAGGEGTEAASDHRRGCGW